jgi:predicted metal-dependent peptidase
MVTLSSDTDLKKRFEKIRVQFLFDHPFLSVLALSLPMRYRTNKHELLETNGNAIFIDEARVGDLSDAQLKYSYAHTLLHILLKHPFRMKERERGTWNRSCDIVINLLLNDFERIGERPDDEVLLEKFRDKSVEEVYYALYDEKEEYEGAPDDENPKEQKYDLLEEQGDTEAAEEEIDAIIVQALGAAQKHGNTPASFLEVVQEVIRPKIDLATLIHTYLTESFFDKKSDFLRPNRRFIHQGLYLPGYVQERSRLVLSIALDRSMSIDQKTFSKFLGIIDGILRVSTDFEVTVIPFDEKVDTQKIVTYDSMDVRPEISFEKGNGGTDFQALLRYINNTLELHTALIVLSDGFFKIEMPPPVDTLFLISQKKNMKRLERYGDVFHFDL